MSFCVQALHRGEAVHGGADFVVHLEHEFRLAVIEVRADFQGLGPTGYRDLLARLHAARDELRAAGYHVSCSPPIIGEGYAQPPTKAGR